MRVQDRIEAEKQCAILYDYFDDRWQTFRDGRLVYTARSLDEGLEFLRRQLG